MKKIIVLIAIAISLYFDGSAKYQRLYMDSTTQNYAYYFCTDSLIVYKMSAAVSGIEWTIKNVGTITDKDSVILKPISNGIFTFSSNESSSRTINIRIFPSVPISPNLKDTTFCHENFSFTVNASKSLYCTYLWKNGSKLQTFKVDTFGLYWVQVTNTCGITYDSFMVSRNNPHPKPNLGSDKTTCWKDTINLKPGYTGLFKKFLWSTGDTIAAINVDTTGNYWVETTDTFGCTERSTTVKLTFIVPLSEQICYVTFDSVTQKNLINWAVDPNFKQAASVKIYSWDTLNNLILIAQVAYQAGQFIDNTSDPQNLSYKYVLSVVDTCGNESEFSLAHKTIRLNKSQFGTEIDFTFSKYEGVTVPYYVLNGIRRNGTSKYVATINATNDGYNYLNADTSLKKYYISFQTPSCSTRANMVVMSNYSTVTTPVSIGKVSNQNIVIYPNPTNNQFTISGCTGEIIITNTLGQSIEREQSSGTIIINSSDWQKGMYIIQFKTRNGLSTKTILKQ